MTPFEAYNDQKAMVVNEVLTEDIPCETCGYSGKNCCRLCEERK